MKRVVIGLVALALAGCQCESGEASGEAEGTASTEPTAEGSGGTERPGSELAVTEDGEGVVFAGTRRTAAATTPERHLVLEPTSPDPEAGEFTLEEAVAGMPIDGQLVAEIGTDLGTLFCDLYADRTPRTVANFIGLARGLRPYWDAEAGQWRTRPYYRGLTFHRVLPGYIVQGGDYLGDGTGTVGYTVPLERHDTLSHDRAGRLALATSSGPDSGGAQFYITDGAAPQLDGTATIFGQCRPEDVVAIMARVPQSGAPDNRPLTPLTIGRLLIRRVEGGAAAATITAPQRPEGEPEVGRGASLGPAELRARMEGVREQREERERQQAEEWMRAHPEGAGHEGHQH